MEFRRYSSYGEKQDAKMMYRNISSRNTRHFENSFYRIEKKTLGKYLFNFQIDMDN
jgi:hypothetical protein